MVPFENSLAFARQQDADDPLRPLRDQFHIPLVQGRQAVYLCGNSLGLQPVAARGLLEAELQRWQDMAVEGHFKGEQPWLTYHKPFREPLGRLAGALPHEVVVMNNLTTNLHLLMASFYRPRPGRHRIVMEGGAFPSDQYAVESQVRWHGYDPADAVVEVKPRPGEHTLRTEDIVRVITDPATQPALVLFGGVNYYTGQVFDMAAIAGAARRAGARVGFDLAHAIGNIPLRLHDWNADFAVWCSYKYLNSGPGGVAGAFVHERHGTDASLPRLAGWWGHDEASRFQMKPGFKPQPGADGWQLANGPVLLMAVHRAALSVFDAAGMTALRAKSERLTGYLAFLLQHDEALRRALQVITPPEPAWRGCQLSMLVRGQGKAVFDRLAESGVIGDWREPDVIRLAPAPLYNGFEDVYRCAERLSACVRQVAGE